MVKKKKNIPTFDFLKQAEIGSIESAKKLLIEKGYVVSDPISVDDYSNNILSLVSFFYKKMSEKYSNRALQYTQTEKDKTFVSSLLKNRKSQGVSTARAYQEVRDIIECLFDCEELIGLTTPITSISILSIDWIIKKVQEILNGENETALDRKFSQFEDNFQVIIDSDDFKNNANNELEFIFRKVVCNATEEKD